MIGLDPNVLVRLLTADDEAQHVAARGAIEAAVADGETLYCSLLVIQELAWVLLRIYRYTPAEVLAAFRQLLKVGAIEVEQAELLVEALEQVDALGVDLADALIGLAHRAAGCSRTLTFDRQACRLPEFQHLKP